MEIYPNMLLGAGNPFINAYVQSDWFGKGIFLSLFFLSIVCWIIIAAKLWQLWSVKKNCSQFLTSLNGSKGSPLEWQLPKQNKDKLHPLFEVFRRIKQRSLLVLQKRDGKMEMSDLEMIESESYIAISIVSTRIEKLIFLLPTIASLAPFLGLLGTVWGILLTFSELGSAKNNQNEMLAGLSMALATTVLGLLIAIPALVANSYLRNEGKVLKKEMEEFSHELLSAIELEHRS